MSSKLRHAVCNNNSRRLMACIRRISHPVIEPTSSSWLPQSKVKVVFFSFTGTLLNQCVTDSYRNKWISKDSMLVIRKHCCMEWFQPHVLRLWFLTIRVWHYGDWLCRPHPLPTHKWYSVWSFKPAQCPSSEVCVWDQCRNIHEPLPSSVITTHSSSRYASTASKGRTKHFIHVVREWAQP